MIFVNPGNSVKDVTGVYINTGNGVKEVVAVYENVNGTLYQVYPDYAYNGSKFAGVLKNGLINLPYALEWYDGNGRQNTGFHGAGINGAITSGALYVTDFVKYQDGSIITPAICTSADNIPFSRYSKVQFTGHWRAQGSTTLYPTIEGEYAIRYSPAITLESIKISGTTSSSVTRYAIASTALRALGEWKLKSGSGDSGTKNFTATVDISGFTRDDTVMEILIGSGGYEYYENRTESRCNFYITGIKFIR